jgi:hypothetical protein
VNGGLLHLAASVPEHLEQLGAAVAAPGGADERCRRFVEAFVRPHGADVPATPKLVDALEALAAQPAVAPARIPLTAPAARALLTPRGERLRRAALLVREAKAARARRKNRKHQS